MDTLRRVGMVHSPLTDLAEAEGAALQVQTAPGAGTRVRLEVPRR